MHSLFSLLAVVAGIATLQPTAIDANALTGRVNALGYQGDYSSEVRRNSAGSRLYLYQWWDLDMPNGRRLPGRGNGVLVLEAGHVVQRLERPASIAYLNDDGQFVAWTDDLKEGITLKNGGHIYVSPYAGRFGVDWSGRYYFNANFFLDSTEIAAIAEQNKILAKSSLHPYAIFSAQDKIYLCGWKGPVSVSICEVCAVSAKGASLVDRRTIENAHEVYDIDPVTGRVLVSSASDYFPVDRIVSLAGGKDIRIGLEHRSPLLFLQPSVLPEQ